SQEPSIVFKKDNTLSATDVNKFRLLLEKSKSKNAFEKNKVALRYDNLDEVEIKDTDNYTVDWNGVRYIKCWIPYDKSQKSIENILLSYTNNLIFLNPTLGYKAVYSIVKKINGKFENPVSDNKIHTILDSIFSYKEQGSLKPIYYKIPRKIIFKKSVYISQYEKLQICIKENALRKIAISKAKMEKIIETWDFEKHGKISTTKIIENNSISKKTVNKYYPEFKKQIQELNIKFKNNTN
ncbi:MAG: hypothetical protein NTZ33_13105, partial [Bacteroidetes bacterium]|nr:hypothetical protein [Bacteroidota bacterium]